MNTIDIKNENGIKTINGRTLNEILTSYKNYESEYINVSNIFNSIANEKDFFNFLKSKRIDFSKTEMLLYIKMLGNFTIIDAYPFFDKIYED